MSLGEALAAYPALLQLCVGALGLLVGSFLNVVIYRLPVMLNTEWRHDAHEILELPDPVPKPEPFGLIAWLRGLFSRPAEGASPAVARFNILTPASRCGACGAAIKPWQNIPVVSWLALRGRAACCGARISARYPLVELLTGLMSAACAWRFGYGLELAGALTLTWSLIALAFIDFDTQFLLDDINKPLAWLGLAFSLLGASVPLAAAVTGALAGYLSLWLVNAIYKLLRGHDGMGQGDFKLLAALGAWLGWAALPQVILLSSVVGAAVGVALIVFRRHGREVPIPFGPYLAAAGWLALMGVDVMPLFMAAAAGLASAVAAMMGFFS